MTNDTYTLPQTLQLTDPRLEALNPHGTVTLTFRDGESQHSTSLPTTLDGTTANSLSDALGTLSGLLNLHTVLGRREAHHPRTMGLTAQALPNGHVGFSSRAATAAAGLLGFNTDLLQLLVPGALPRELHEEPWGWFAPNSSPEQFGSLYLVAAGSLDGSDWPDWRSGTQHRTAGFPGIGWALVQTGVDGYLAFAPWDNEDAIRALVDRALTEDIEQTLTMRALADSESVAEGLRRHEYRSQLYAAREAFVGKLLRPRLVPDLVAQTATDCGVTLARSYRGPTTTMHELNDYRIFGWRDTPSRMAAVYSIALDPALNKDAFLAFTSALQNGLDARRLGTVMIDPLDHSHAWITAAPELLEQFRAAFLLPPNARLVNFREWLATRT
jgi:hypothetical protein